jgi:hypothetical protein
VALEPPYNPSIYKAFLKSEERNHASDQTCAAVLALTVTAAEAENLDVSVVTVKKFTLPENGGDTSAAGGVYAKRNGRPSGKSRQERQAAISLPGASIRVARARY